MKTIYIIIAFVIHFTAIAQDDNTIFSVIQVTHSSINNIEDTDYSLEKEKYLLFSLDEDKFDFVNISGVDNTFSLGEIKNIKIDKVNLFQTIYYFDWHYSNSYDEVKGVANIKLEINKKIGAEEYDQAIIEITDSKGLNLLYKGNLVHYKNEYIFYYNFKKAIDNQK